MKIKAIYSIAISIVFFVSAFNTSVCGQVNLVKAIREGDIEKANKIIDKSSAEDLNQIVNIKSGGTTDNTFSLCEAVRKKDSLLVKKILKKGANPNQVTFISPYYFTPLMKASENNDLASVKLLVEYGANVNYQLDKQGKEYLLGFEIDKTALHFAAEKNSAEVAEFLTKSGANVNSQTKEGKTPLMKAVNYNATDAQKESALANKAFYLSAEADKSISNYRESFLLKSRYFDVICVLLNNHADINKQDTAGNTALHYAILKLDKYNDTRTAIHQILSYYPNVNIANNEGNTPLLLALRSDLLFESNLLLYLKADVTAKNKAGESVFDAIIETDNLNMDVETSTMFVANLKRLFEMGANDKGSGLLDWLSIAYYQSYLNNHIVDFVRLSLDSGSDPNFSACEKCSSTFDKFIKAYQEDSWNGRERFYSILELFIEHGATNIKNKDAVMSTSINNYDNRLIELLIKSKKLFTQEQLQLALDAAKNRISYLKTKNLEEKDIEIKIEKTNKIIEILEKAVAESNQGK
jgi:ankyrin repeat protein